MQASISSLIRGQSTIRQLDILMRADRLFAHLFSDRRGRYYGGPLTEEQVRILDPEQFTNQTQIKR